MSRYDGLIIPRSYNEYINKSDPLTLAQALQQNNVLSGVVAAGDNKAVKSAAVATALANYLKIYEVAAYDATPLSEITWTQDYYARITIPQDVNKIISAEILGFSLTTNGIKYQLVVGSDGKSLYVAKVDASYTPEATEKIGFRITYI